MNSYRQAKLLRFHLLSKARSAQRALDYSIQGYTLRHAEFSREVYSLDLEGEEHHHRVKELCRELMSGGSATPSEAHFALAALSISNALHVAHSAAIGIAQDTMRLLESPGIQPCAVLEAAGRHVNAAMRTAIIALFAKDVSEAHAALRHKPQLQLRELDSVALHPHIDRWAGAQGDFERSVVRNLREVARQTHEIIDAILFWWDGNSNAAYFGSGSLPVTQQSVATPPAYLSSERAPIPKMIQGCSC